MPEGHTLHRLARDHQKHFAGQTIAVSSPQGRFATGAELVDGRTLLKAEAWGKHLFHRYGPDAVVHVHLGLYGKFEPHLGEVTEPRGAVRMRMVGAERWTDLRGAITCEVITADDVGAVTARLGPDPLRRSPDPDRAWARIGRSRAPIAGLLMDQAVVAGIGNVYRAELLFRHHVDPYLPGKALGRSRWEQMWDDLVELMRLGVRKGRIITIRPGDDHGDTPGDLPRGRRGGARSYVYRRAGLPCRVCGTTVLRADLAGRNLFWCPTCQAG